MIVKFTHEPCLEIAVADHPVAARYKITKEVASSCITKEFSNDDSEDAHRRHEGQFVHVHSTAQEGESPVFSLIPNAADESIAAGKPMQQYLNIKKENRIGARKNFILFLVQLLIMLLHRPHKQCHAYGRKHA